MLVLVVFPRSRPCLLQENDNRPLFEIASTVSNGNDRLRTEGKISSPYPVKLSLLDIVSC